VRAATGTDTYAFRSKTTWAEVYTRLCSKKRGGESEAAGEFKVGQGEEPCPRIAWTQGGTDALKASQASQKKNHQAPGKGG